MHGAHAPLAVLFPAPCGPSPARQPTLCALGPGRPAVSGAGYIHPGGTAQRHSAGRHGGGTGGAGPGTGEKRAPGLVSAGRLHPDLWPASDGRTAILPVLVLPGKFPLLHGALCPALAHQNNGEAKEQRSYNDL